MTVRRLSVNDRGVNALLTANASQNMLFYAFLMFSSAKKLFLL